MSAKTGTYKNKMTQCLGVFEPWNPSIKSKTFYQSDLSVQKADQTDGGTVQK